MQFLQWIKSLFSASVNHNDLESYVAGKYPKNTADVEHWISIYTQEKAKWIF